MDAVTHTLVGVVMWRAGLAPNEPRLWAPATLLVAANVADTERFFRLVGDATYIRNYHGATHSLLGTAALVLAVAALTALGLKRAKRPYRFEALIGAALLGAGSHLLLDLFQGYGERLLWPFFPARFGHSLMASFDLANLALLLVALAAPAVLNAVNAEIGAPRVSYARYALAGLIALALLLPVRSLLRVRAEAASAAVLLEEHESHGVHPSPFVPWRWYLVQETSISYLASDVDAFSGRASLPMVRFRKPIPNNLLLAARETEIGRAFLDLAVFPLFSLEEGRRGILVRIRDLDFYIPGASDRPYSVEVEVNSQLRVLAERAVF